VVVVVVFVVVVFVVVFVVVVVVVVVVVTVVILISKCQKYSASQYVYQYLCHRPNVRFLIRSLAHLSPNFYSVKKCA